MDHTLSLLIEDASQIAGTRREALELLPRSLYDTVERGEISIIITELVSNILKHAGHGEILINPVAHDISRGLEIIALDTGPGIPSVATSMRDGFSTSGTAGNGLGAVKRLAAQFDIYSEATKGTAVVARYVPEKSKSLSLAPRPSLHVGGLNVPLHGEVVCGDDWECRLHPDGAVLLVADGLGHGPDAHRAAEAAINVFRKADLRSTTLMEDMHFALRSTRGAAASIAWIEPERGVVRFSGVGNVAGAIADASSSKKFANINGTLGHVLRKNTEFSYPWDEDQVLIMHSDGLGSQWSLSDYPGITSHLPTLIAAVAYRDHTRRRDDATVVVVKRAS